MSKPVLPQGTRDFPAAVLQKRQFLFREIREVFELSGFEPLETPAMENLDTLTGKYGEEGDQLLFKILNNGLDHPGKKETATAGFAQVLEGRNSAAVTERALRYDLTIPFARFVAMNHQQLTFPFRRYQIQPVWRADRPQKGRYREFYQCDADIVGSRSLLNEVELVQLYLDVFARLKLPVEVKINHRGILAGLAALCGGAAQLGPITVAIDKLDKIGWDKVQVELETRGLDALQIGLIGDYLAIAGSNTEKLHRLQTLVTGQAALEGVRQLAFILSFFPGNTDLVVDLSLARGLSYYTGAIVEVRAKDAVMGSIGGGGRYDDLTGLFGVKDMPGVGISFGVDRIYDVMESLQLFPDSVAGKVGALFFNLGEAPAAACVRLIRDLRSQGVRCELYHETAKFDKQFKYAEKKGYPFVVIIGEEELASGNAKVKNLQRGEQVDVSFAAIAGAIG